MIPATVAKPSRAAVDNPLAMSRIIWRSRMSEQPQERPAQEQDQLSVAPESERGEPRHAEPKPAAESDQPIRRVPLAYELEAYTEEARGHRGEVF
jgi:hypothetical protein